MVQSALREQFIAAITHDIRTPLSNASIAAQIIESRASNDALRAMARKILDNTARIDTMTRDLLDCIVFNSGEHLPLAITPFDMAELAADMATPRVQLDTVSVQGYWCRESMRRALENLLGNAMKYGTDGKSVELTVRGEKSRVRISVHNHGDPIPASQLESIFQIYRRAQAAKGHRDGWGVGLPYARRVAESHGGSIIVTSSADSGTTFIIDVPIDARPFEGATTVA
jgi:signal transduction histidine kinase